MNWLSFFIGTTSAMVFMGIVLFLLGFLREIKPKKPTKIEEELIYYWQNSQIIGEQKVAALQDLVTVMQKK